MDNDMYQPRHEEGLISTIPVCLCTLLGRERERGNRKVDVPTWSQQKRKKKRKKSHDNQESDAIQEVYLSDYSIWLNAGMYVG